MTPSASPILDSDLLDEVEALLELRRPNREAIESLVLAIWSHYHEKASADSFEAVIDSATGAGKTYIMAGAIGYLARTRGVRDFVIVAPGRTILRKTLKDFSASGTRSLMARLGIPVTLVTADTFDSADAARAMDDSSQVKIYVFTVQALVRPKSRQGRRTHEFREGLGAAFYGRLKEARPLVVFADEHHAYYGPQFSSAVRNLDPWALVGLTATPHRKTPKDQIIYRYPLAAAIADRFVKTPVIVGRRDDRADPRTKLLDGATLLNQKATIANEWSAATGQGLVKPLMLVVASDTAQADSWAGIVRSDDFMSGKYADGVLVIHSNVHEADEPDLISRLEAVERVDSPIQIVISVHMLKEGWDVRNVYVLLSTQPSLSDVLTAQVLGRGLRLPWGSYTGVQMLDTLEVIAHDRYEDLLRNRNVLAKAFIDTATRTTIRVGGKGQAKVDRIERPVDILPIVDDGDLMMSQEPAAADSATGSNRPAVATIGERSAAAGNAARLLADQIAPRRPVLVPLVIPTVVGSRFSLSDITELEPFRRLGERLRTDPEYELRRTLVGGRVVTGSDGTKRVEIVTSAALDRIRAQGVLIPAGELRARLADTLLSLPIVASRADQLGTQKRGANRILDAFFDGLNGGADELLSAYLERANVRLCELVIAEHRRFTASPVFEEEVTFRSLDSTRVNTRVVSGQRHGPFDRSVAYEGWRRSLYVFDWFDSSLERDFAILVDEEDTTDFWVRLQRNDLPLVWSDGQRRYNPDFIVGETNGSYWLVEVKQRSQIPSEDTQAKRRAALRWAATVNDSGQADGTWGYLVAGDDDVSQARGSWSALKSLALR